MAAHKEEKDVRVETSLHTSLNSSLRRKSLHVQNAASTALSENNDEAERLARRRELNTHVTPTGQANASDRRRSLGLGFLAQMSAPEIKDRISECIKLSTENKINAKNAFSLEIIDFMTYMIRKQDSNMSNLQVASTSLDVSSKIYGYRVDGVHTEIMKMIGGMDKQEDDSAPDNAEQTNNAENQENELQKQIIKKKKRNKQKIFNTVDSLRGAVETMKPSLWMMGDNDLQTTDGLYQVMMPNHANSKFYLHLYNDVIVDTVEQKKNLKDVDVHIPKVQDLSKLEMCPPLNNFEFQGWTDDNKEEETKETESEENNENRFQFDLDASVPTDEEPVDMNYYDIQDEEDNVEGYVEIQRPVEKIVDLCKVVTNAKATTISEYSFLQKSTNLHWAGPSHWKMSNFKRLLGTSKVVETCHQEPARKRKEIEVSYDDKAKEAVKVKFTPSKHGKIKHKNHMNDWQEESLTLPRDMHYSISSTNKLYLHQSIDIKITNKDELNATHVSDIIDYDYNNENDTSNYCPNVPNDDYDANEHNNQNGDFRSEGEAQMIFTGDNLVTAPKLTNKISIAYSVRAKRVDMRQLKKSIWKGLISNSDKENINIQDTVQREAEDKMQEVKCFSDIYKTLPDMLTKTNVDALSFPLSIVSLLHLANEKTLNIQSLPDMSDIIVQGN